MSGEPAATGSAAGSIQLSVGPPARNVLGDLRSLSTAGRLMVALGALAIVGRFAIEAFAIMTSTWRDLVGRVPDDSFYYFEIARRAANGGGFTFDGVNETNGFHPLWEVVLLPVARLFRDDLNYVRASLILGLILLFGACVLITGFVWRLAGPMVALGGMALVVHTGTYLQHQGSLISSAVDGMESALVLLTLAILLLALERFGRVPTRGNAVVVGISSASIVLARLDLIIVAAGVGVAVLYRSRSPRRFGAWAAGTACTAAPFAIWWISTFGTSITTSATAKSFIVDRWYEANFGSSDRLSPEFLADYVSALVRYPATILRSFLGQLTPSGPLSSAGALLVVGLALYGVYLARSRLMNPTWPLAPGPWAALILCTLLGIKACFDVANVGPWATTWYAAPARLILPLAISCLAFFGVSQLLRSHRTLGTISLAALAFLCLPVNVQALNPKPLPAYLQLDRMADWLLEAQPEGRTGARDAGLLGFRLHERGGVINLDGLVNDYEFVERMKAGDDLLELARSQGVDILATRIQERDMEILECGQVLWNSSLEDSYVDGIDNQRRPFYVVDISDC